MVKGSRRVKKIKKRWHVLFNQVLKIISQTSRYVKDVLALIFVCDEHNAWSVLQSCSKTDDGKRAALALIFTYREKRDAWQNSGKIGDGKIGKW